jgi:hypothetical protein
MATVIPIAGKAEHGKDSAAVIIKELLEKKGKKVCIIHFADYLKYMCKQYLGWDGEKDEEGRNLLQYEGTDYVRSKDFDFWLDRVHDFIRLYEERFDYFLIPDARFPNECDRFKEYFKTITLKIVRLNFENRLTEEQRKHPSETALDGYAFDVMIQVETGLDKLRKGIKVWLDDI